MSSGIKRLNVAYVILASIFVVGALLYHADARRPDFAKGKYCQTSGDDCLTAWAYPSYRASLAAAEAEIAARGLHDTVELYRDQIEQATNARASVPPQPRWPEIEAAQIAASDRLFARSLLNVGFAAVGLAAALWGLFALALWVFRGFAPKAP